MVVFTLFWIGSLTSFFEARAPELVVTAFIEALQKDDLAYLEKYVDMQAIANQTRHAYDLNQLKELFGKVDVSHIQFSKPRVKPQTQVIRMNMTQPLSFTFELQHQNAKEGKGDFYRIIAITP